MNSSTDNPLIFEEHTCPDTGADLPQVISAGKILVANGVYSTVNFTELHF